MLCRPESPFWSSTSFQGRIGKDLLSLILLIRGFVVIVTFILFVNHTSPSSGGPMLLALEVWVEVVTRIAQYAAD